MLTILLYGPLGQRFGRVHRYRVSSAAEAVRALCATLPGFRGALELGAYRVLRGDAVALSAHELTLPCSKRTSLRIVPVLAGAGDGGVNQFILGAALIYFSGGLASAFGATATAAGAFGITAGTFSGMGWALMFGGAARLLFGPDTPKLSEEPQNMPSYAFAGAVNTTKQGNPVPVLYGEMVVGSQLISAGLQVRQLGGLSSTQQAQFLDLVSEGPIVGLVNGERSVYLDDTPLRNPDGSYNFAGVTVQERLGTVDQDYIPGFGAVENPQSVGDQVRAAAPVIRTITNPDVNALRLTLMLPRLATQNQNSGKLSGASVVVAIDVQPSGGSFAPQILRQVFSSSGFVYANGVARNTTVAADFEIEVAWLAESWLGEYTIQYELQYRSYGSSAWLVWESGNFSDTSHVTARDGEWEPLSTHTASGSRTYRFNLTAGQYEFRVVKTAGSYRAGTRFNVGLAYGGAVSLGSYQLGQPDYVDEISGQTLSQYQRDYTFALTGIGPWNVRVRRLTPDAALGSGVQDALYWASYTEVVHAKLTYPYSALVALTLDAGQVSSTPRRGYHLKGRIIRVPSNYDPLLRRYSGVWDGTLVEAYSNNPAWVFLDLLTHPRYGLGQRITLARVDIWALYTIAQYCDEFVADGFGGVEPRFTCNLYLQTREEAYTVVQNLAALFCSIAFWSQGSVGCVQDAQVDPESVDQLFVPANVVQTEVGHFNYAGTSQQTRFTVVLVTWNDPNNLYRAAVEYVEDAEAVARYGVVQTEVAALGCTSRGQAHRFGRRILYANSMETQTISLRAGLDGLGVYPGKVIKTSDPVRAGLRLGGRVVAATPSLITLDAAVTLVAQKTYTLWVVLPDGAVQQRNVSSGAGTTQQLAVASPYSAAPQPQSIWVLAANDLLPETWRIISVAEVEEGTQAEIVGLSYRPDKYLAIEQGLVLQPLPVSALQVLPSAPQNLAFAESLYRLSATAVGVRLAVSWQGSGVYYEFQYRPLLGNWINLTTATPSVDLAPIEAGEYEFRVRAINALGSRSSFLSATQKVYGLSAAPSDVSNFALAAINGSAHLSFDPAPDLDVRVGGHLRLRHTPNVVNPSWSAALDIGPQIPGTATNATLPLLAGSYLAKWVDASGNQSPNATFISTEAASVLHLNSVALLAEAPAFAGAKNLVAAWNGHLALDSLQTVGQMTEPISQWPRLSALGGVQPWGEYHFANRIDLGSVQTSQLSAVIEAAGVDLQDLISQRGLISSWPSVSGALVSEVGCTLWVRTTPDDPAAAPTWSEWQPLVVGAYTARAFEFKAQLTSRYPGQNIWVSGLSVRVDMPDRSEVGNDIASGAGVYHLVFERPFMATPALGITAQNMQTGDYYTLSNKTPGGFDIVFKNAAGIAVSRTFDYHAKGF